MSAARAEIARRAREWLVLNVEKIGTYVRPHNITALTDFIEDERKDERDRALAEVEATLIREIDCTPPFDSGRAVLKRALAAVRKLKGAE